MPVLTPLGVDPAHPFPHISSRSLNLAVTLRDPVEASLFARIKLPETIRRFVPVPSKSRSRSRTETQSYSSDFVWLEQLIAAHLDLLFPGLEIAGAYPFRVLRDADIEIQSDEAGDLLDTIEQGLRQRRFGSVVNLTIQPGMPKKVRELLRDNLEMAPDDVWEVEGPLGLSDLCGAHRPRPPRPQRSAAHTRVRCQSCAAGRIPSRRSGAATCCCTTPTTPSARSPTSSRRRRATRRCWRSSRRSIASAANSPIVQALLEANDARQAGGGAGGAEGALRRREQHRVGAHAGARGRPCRLWAGGPEDAREGRAGGAPRGRRPAALRPPGHRQLQRRDGARLRRFRAADLPSQISARTPPICSTR